MVRALFLSIVVFLLFVRTVAQGTGPAELKTRDEPRLVLVETLAMDLKRRTVVDLAAEEFLLTVGDQPVPIDTFELHCPMGATDDPELHKNDDPGPAPIAPDTPRKIVLAIDYNFLAIPDRPAVLEAIESMLIMSKTPAEEIMLVALADGLRVEQRFTTSTRELVSTLRRMKHDVTLSTRIFDDPSADRSYFDGLVTLMDLLADHEGAKVVVLFSTLLTTRDRNEQWFQDLAARATTARTAIYPNWARGLQLGTTRHGARTLQRLATETGGRPAVATSDLSVQYRRAQRDLSCRYVLGVRLDDNAAATMQPLRVRVGRSGVIVLYPQRVRMWTAGETRLSRLRARFVDPENSESPLVRVSVFPMRPVDGEWDTLLTLHFPARIEAQETTLELTATLGRGGRLVEQYQASISIPAGATGRSGTRWVTVIGDGSLKPGSYDLEVALSRKGDAEVVSSAIRFEVPDLPRKGLFVKGPVLAQVNPGGILIRGDTGDAPNDTALDEVLGGENGFEPLLVNQLDGSGRFLSYWEACLAGSKDVPPEGSMVRRRFVTQDGVEAHTLPPLRFEIERKGQMRCMHALDEIAPRTLRPGEYKLEVSLEKPGGEDLASAMVLVKID